MASSTAQQRWCSTAPRLAACACAKGEERTQGSRGVRVQWRGPDAKGAQQGIAEEGGKTEARLCGRGPKMIDAQCQGPCNQQRARGERQRCAHAAVAAAGPSAVRALTFPTVEATAFTNSSTASADDASPASGAAASTALARNC